MMIIVVAPIRPFYGDVHSPSQTDELILMNLTIVYAHICVCATLLMPSRSSCSYNTVETEISAEHRHSML